MKQPGEGEYRIAGADYVDFDMEKADPASGGKKPFSAADQPPKPDVRRPKSEDEPSD